MSEPIKTENTIGSRLIFGPLLAAATLAGWIGYDVFTEGIDAGLNFPIWKVAVAVGGPITFSELFHRYAHPGIRVGTETTKTPRTGHDVTTKPIIRSNKK